MNKIQISTITFILFLLSSVAISTENISIHKRIDKLLLDGNFKKAEEEANAAYKKNPNDPETICAKACVYRNMAYKSGIQVDYAKLGIKEFQTGTAQLTPEILKEAFKDTYYYDKEIFSKAEPLYFKIIELDKNYLNAYFNLLNTYMVMEDFQKYFNVIDLFIKNQKANDACKGTLLDLAGKLFKRESYKQAEKLYLIILKNYPNYTHAKSDLGAVYSSIGEIERASLLFKEVYNKDPNDLTNSGNLTKTYIIQEKFSDAYNVTLSILKVKDSDYFDYFSAGQLAYLLGKDYSKYFNKFIEMRKGELKNDEKDFFIEVSKKYLELPNLSDKDKVEFLNHILIQFFENNYNYHSIITANTILKIKTEKNSLIVLGATFDNKVNFPQKALKYLDKINEYSKSDPTIMEPYDLNYNYARSYYNLKKYDEAIKYLRRNIEERKDDAKVLYAIGKAYKEKRDADNACKYFRMCSELNDKKNMDSINAAIREAFSSGCYRKK
jgi:Flp pilus assembly protein TadD